MARKTRPAADRFWEKVSRNPVGCWMWTGATTHGYGMFQLGRGIGTIRAPRWAFQDAFGPIPNGLHVLHRCDQPACVRPSHLFLGTNADNIRDMMAKGRSAQQRRLQCPQGHPYSSENTYLDGGRRRCRECRRTKRRVKNTSGLPTKGDAAL